MRVTEQIDALQSMAVDPNRFLVAPDRIHESSDSTIVILFTKDNNQAHILTPVNKEKFNELKKLDRAKLINIEIDP